MRLLVLAIAVVFTAGFGVLTALDISRYGVTGVSVVAIVILVLFSVGIIGALKEPPRQ